jgi:hypothetical protein
LGIRGIPGTVQVATNGIGRDLVAVWVCSHVAVPVDVAPDGVPKSAQPAGLPARDREVTPDRVVLEVAIGRTEQHGQEAAAGDAAAAPAHRDVATDSGNVDHHCKGILGRQVSTDRG